MQKILYRKSIFLYNSIGAIYMVHGVACGQHSYNAHIHNHLKPIGKKQNNMVASG